MPEPSFMIRERPLPPGAVDRPFVELAITPKRLRLDFVRHISGGDLLRLSFTPSDAAPLCSWLIRLGEIMLAAHGWQDSLQTCIQAAATDFAEQLGQAVLQRQMDPPPS